MNRELLDLSRGLAYPAMVAMGALIAPWIVDCLSCHYDALGGCEPRATECESRTVPLKRFPPLELGTPP